MCPFVACCSYWKCWDPVNRVNHTSWVAIVTPTDRPKSVRNRCVIAVFGCVLVLSRCFLDFSVGVGAFALGLSQISSFFHLTNIYFVFSEVFSIQGFFSLNLFLLDL